MDRNEQWRKTLPLLIILILIFFFFSANQLPEMGKKLGKQARKPYRQAKWMLALLSGTEEESLRAEEEFGRECSREFSKQFPGTASLQDKELVSPIGERLAKMVKGPQRNFHFYAIASSTANAFALPGGFVFITTRLLDLCDRRQDEIAFFLGHEIAHIVCGHARDRMTADALLRAVSARLSSAGGLLHQTLSKGYSRDMELEADKQGAQLMKAAGFDPQASARALLRLTEASPDLSGLMEYFSSHPSIKERVRALA
jgi:beta-barrel assembly-enhancing protease